MYKDRKSEYLEMNYSRARARLDRIIMLSMAQKLGIDYCFRCGEKIQTVKDFSIDHKNPWLYEGKDLFWDLENISFSHYKCNVGEHRTCKTSEKIPKGGPKPKVGPDGTSWCSGHKNFLPNENFSKDKKRWNGLDLECKECRSKRRKNP